MERNLTNAFFSFILIGCLCSYSSNIFAVQPHHNKYVRHKPKPYLVSHVETYVSDWFSQLIPVPYVGVDLQVEFANLKERYGKPLYKRKLLIGGATLGLQVNEWFGFEASANVPIKRRAKTRRLNEGEFFPGDSVQLERGTFEDYRTKLVMDSYNFDVLGYLPLDALCLPRTRLFVALGGSALRIVAKQRLLRATFEDFDFPLTNENIEVSSPSFRNSKRRLVPHARFGLEQLLIDCLHIRFFLDWKKTTSLNLKGIRSVERPLGAPRLKFTDTYSIGAGIFYRFV